MYVSSTETKVKELIPEDLKDHVVKALKNDGLYRHYYVGKPGTSNQHFEVITWPGCLCYTGDMGEYLFQRTDDMIAFMRGSATSFAYCKEKCVAASRDGIEEWSEDLLLYELEQLKLEDYDGWTQEEFDDAKERVDGERHDECRAETAMCESELWDYTDTPRCFDYTYRFLWCLHALKWLCERV